MHFYAKIKAWSWLDIKLFNELQVAICNSYWILRLCDVYKSEHVFDDGHQSIRFIFAKAKRDKIPLCCVA